MTPWTQVGTRAAWRRYDDARAVMAVVVRHRSGAVYALTGEGATFVETKHDTIDAAQAAADARLANESGAR